MSPLSPPKTIRTLILAACLLSGFALAQTAPAASPASPPPATNSRDMKYEHIVIEDAGSKIDEVRIGGQTQSITVQSKLGGEPYEIKPHTTSKPDGNGNTAKAMWNIGKF
jgi:hypothetical protein